MSDAVDILPDAHVPAWIAWIVVYGVGVLGYLGLLVGSLVSMVRNTRRGRLADSAADGTRALAPGEAVVVGVVEAGPDGDAAVRVEIEQHGTEKLDSGRWTHLWSETKRRMHVRPFAVRLASGERVLVEPTREAILVDDLDGLVRIDDTRRLRTAELTPGERVIATGVLERRMLLGGPGGASGYRDGAAGWVLRPPRREPMLLSTEPLGKRFRERATTGRAAMLAAMLVFLGVHGVLLGYHLRVWLGRAQIGTVIEQRYYETRDSEDDVVHHYVVTAQIDGLRVQDDVYPDGFAQLHEGAAIAVRRVPSASWASSLGARPTTSFWRLFLVVAGLVAILATIGVFLPQRWQDSKVNQSGSGRLRPSDPPPP